MTNEEFFAWVAHGLERRRNEEELREAAKKMRGPQLVFTYAVVWLLGAAVILGLAAGVLALGKLLVSLWP